MIIVQSIQPSTGSATLRVVDGDPFDVKEAFARVATAAQRLGICDLRLRLAAGERVEEIQALVPDFGGEESELELPGSAWRGESGTLTTVLPPRIRCRIEEGRPSYELSVPRVQESLSLIAAVTSLVLATYGPEENDLMKLRIAVYEICANIVEHGLSADPDRQPAEEQVQLAIAFGRGEITGWVQDTCQRFDPRDQGLVHVSERVASRYRRGYGISMLLQLLDEIDHEFNDTGNRVSFRKRIEE